jgi:hypothetical protein
MQKPFKLILDTFSEVYDLLSPWADGEFWDFSTVDIIPGAVYVIGRRQFMDNAPRIRELASAGTILPVFSDPKEGSDTMMQQIRLTGIDELLKQNKILIITGGDIAKEYPYLLYEYFLPKVLDYDENIIAGSCIDQIYNKQDKPYKFLFLNGRGRTHRKYLLERLSQIGLLDQSLWSNLEHKKVYPLDLKFEYQGVKFTDEPMPVKYLPEKYEIEKYRLQIGQPFDENSFAKYQLFNSEWGDIYINPDPYIDTYFSLVTETVFTYPYNFRTEKIAKPLAMGHPFIAVAGTGFYKELHNLGFQTFGKLIDESFDQMHNDQERIERISDIVEDLCQQDLAKFLKECYNICKYNQQHLAEIRPKIRSEFPERFFQFINERSRV